jgi:ankyrin repeat protein
MKREWMQAIEQGDLVAVRALAAEPGVLDSLDRYGQTAVMRAAKAGSSDVVALLVELGANLDHVAKFNLSAIMLAVIWNHPEIVRILRDGGADLNLRGSGAPGFHDKTALDLALAAGRDQIATILGDAGYPDDRDVRSL